MTLIAHLEALVRQHLSQFHCFDSHDVIAIFHANKRQEYEVALSRYQHLPDPVRELHRQIGLALGRLGLLRKDRRVLSFNLRGRLSWNQGWVTI